MKMQTEQIQIDKNWTSIEIKQSWQLKTPGVGLWLNIRFYTHKRGILPGTWPEAAVVTCHGRSHDDIIIFKNFWLSETSGKNQDFITPQSELTLTFPTL